MNRLLEAKILINLSNMSKEAQNLVTEVLNYKKFKIGTSATKFFGKKVHGDKVAVNRVNRSTPNSRY